MTDLQMQEVHSRNLTAFFDTREAADRAIADLVQDGIPREHVTVTGGAAATATTTVDDKGFWESLKDMFLPEEDRYVYSEGLRRGGYVVSVRTDEANYTRVLDILDQDGAVDLDQREATWRSEGWAGYSDETALTTGVAPAPVALASTTTTAAATPIAASVKAAAPTTAVSAGTDEVIPVYEESLRVGKRDVNQGRVRVRSYVVSTPVTEQVSLHSENVQVVRRAVDRPVTATDAMFQDRVIEAEEHVEEAVIGKDARVTEEISLRKNASDRTQTVTDSVRHTEVEVTDERGRVAGTAKSFVATDTSAIVEHMDVIASDGSKIGTVDHMDGPDKIKLAKTTSPDGQHHYIPLAWVDHVDAHVHLNKTSAAAKSAW